MNIACIQNAMLKEADWDPNMERIDGTQFSWDPKGQIDEAIKKSLHEHYARILGAAYLASTGKVLKNPEKKIEPRYGYTIGRAANVDPEIMAQLDPYYQDHIGGWSTKQWNVTPGMVLDSIDMVNEHGWQPLMKTPSDPNARFRMKNPLAIANKRLDQDVERDDK